VTKAAEFEPIDGFYCEEEDLRFEWNKHGELWITDLADISCWLPKETQLALLQELQKRFPPPVRGESNPPPDKTTEYDPLFIKTMCGKCGAKNVITAANPEVTLRLCFSCYVKQDRLKRSPSEHGNKADLPRPH
jgi:hypothetical protein